MPTRRWSIASCVLLLLACDGRSPEDAGGLDDAGPADAGAPDAGPPREVPCVDESILELSLFDTVAAGLITDESDGDGTFRHHIDATGGGLAPTESFVYARFANEGLVKVAVGDLGAFDSTEWDIAFRRYVVRLNSGVSGPGNVTGARTAPGTELAALASVPDGLSYRDEVYFTESCDVVPDGSGIGAPSTALSSFWSYPGCVAMTGNVYVVALASGRHVKLQVLSYYAPEVQATCDASATISTPSGAGNLRLRWAFLD